MDIMIAICACYFLLDSFHLFRAAAVVGIGSFKVNVCTVCFISSLITKVFKFSVM